MKKSAKTNRDVLAVFRALQITPVEPSPGQTIPWWPEQPQQQGIVITRLTNGTGVPPKQYAELE